MSYKLLTNECEHLKLLVLKLMYRKNHKNATIAALLDLMVEPEHDHI